MKPRPMRALVIISCLAFLAACGAVPPSDQIDPAGGLTRDDYLDLRHRNDNQAAIPPIPDLPPIPTQAESVTPPVVKLPGHDKLVSVTVTDNVPLRDVLMDLAHEAKVNLELDPHVHGGVIFSANNQPFDDVLRRICALADLRLKVDGAFIHIEMDDPYQETYQLDYLSLARHSTSDTAISTDVFDVDVSSTSGGGTATSHSGGSVQNNSTSRISSASDADFWGEVDKSLTQILTSTSRKTDKTAVPSYSLDRQAGMVTVYGDSVQQAAVKSYFHKLKRKAYSQVLIDARIIEVELNDAFQSGINWRTLFSGAVNAAARFGPAAAGAPFVAATTATDGVFTAAVNSHDFAGIINFVKTFGTTRVLSAPRLTVLNNQSAVLKVATNQVYFVTQAQFTTVTNANGSAVTTTPVYTSTPRTVPVGLVMTVQPAIDADHDRVTMTLRPTISRVVDNVNDPSIGLNAAAAGVTTTVNSQIPVLAVREMDSVIQLHSGEVVVMGGLMQDGSQNTDTGVPGLDTVPFVGQLAKSRDNQGKTTELVILLRAVVTDSPNPDAADEALYTHYNADPRPLPLHHHDLSVPKEETSDDAVEDQSSAIPPIPTSTF